MKYGDMELTVEHVSSPLIVWFRIEFTTFRVETDRPLIVGRGMTVEELALWSFMSSEADGIAGIHRDIIIERS